MRERTIKKANEIIEDRNGVFEILEALKSRLPLSRFQISVYADGKLRTLDIPENFCPYLEKGYEDFLDG